MRDRWTRMASGWEAYADAWHRDTLPVSTWMVEAIAPQPGHRVLELAAGLGDTGYLAAELVAPGGEVILSDFVPEMLTAAQKRAKHGNVRFRQMDMNVPLDQPAASLDGVLCRWGYMLVNDPEAALKETRRVLRPGGTVALSAWTDPGENPWTSAAPRILQQRGIVGPDQPGPGQFAWADRDVIRENLEAAGFVEYRIEPLDFVMRYDDVDHWWVVQTQTGSRVAEADKTMDYAARSDVLADLEKVAERFELPDGSLAVPARTWVAAATA